ncbi:MAG: molybdenum cofactor guanylyltransferase MobA [Pseudomonadota bacterium]
MIERAYIAGVVLAGGLGRRMGGGDKGLRLLAGRPVLDHVIARVGPQVAELAINANGEASRLADWRLPVVPDPVAGNPGPLAGVLSGLDWAAELVPGVTHVASFPCDAPFLPLDLVVRLAEVLNEQEADLVCAHSGGRDHPVIGLWPVAARDELRSALLDEGIRKVDAWTSRYRLANAVFSTEPHDPFFNANTPDDLATAENLITKEPRTQH